MNFYLGIVILFFILLGYIMLLKNLFDYNFSTSLFLTLTLIMFFMTIFCMLNILLIGVYFISLLGLVFLVLFGIKNIKDKKLKFSEIFAFQNILFAILFFCTIFICRKIYLLMDWDECSYWATAVKRLFYFNSFLGGENFHSFGYPPALTTYQYFIVKLLGMQDKSIYFAQYLYVLSGLLFLIKNIKWKNALYAIITFTSSIIFLILLLKPYMFTLYAEFPIMITLGCSIYFFITSDKKFDYIFIGLMLFNLALIKSNSFACSLLPITIIAFNILNTYIEHLKGKSFSLKSLFKTLGITLKEKKFEIILMFIPFIANFVFNNIFLRFNNLKNPHTINGNISNFWNTILKNEDIVPNYFNAMNSNYTYSNFNISSILIISFLIVSLYILYRICNNKSRALTSNKYISIAYFSVFAVYSALILYSYLYIFSPFEASLLASYERYINAFLGGAGLTFISLLVYCLCIEDFAITKKIKMFIIIVFFTLLTITRANDMFDISKLVFPSTKIPIREEIVLGKEMSRAFAKYFTENDKIHIISEGDYGLTIWSTMYYMCPLKTYDPRFEKTMWSIETPTDTPQVPYSTQITQNDYLNYLKTYNFTHVLVIQTNPVLYAEYKDLFDNLPYENIVPVGIYEINYEKSKLSYVDIDLNS